MIDILPFGAACDPLPPLDRHRGSLPRFLTIFRTYLRRSASAHTACSSHISPSSPPTLSRGRPSLTQSSAWGSDLPVIENGPFNVSVAENVDSSALFSIQLFHAGDEDGGVVAYSFISPYASLLGKIAVFVNGRVDLVASLDADVGPNPLTFKVVASNDVGSAAENVTLYIRDVNDNPPKFEREVYEFDLDQGVPLGTVAGTVSARDADVSEAFSRVNYTLLLGSETGEDGVGTFSVASDTGRIFTIAPLDLATRHFYLLKIKAHDVADPTLSNICFAEIRINNIDHIHSRIVRDATDPGSAFPAAEVCVAIALDSPLGYTLPVPGAWSADRGQNGSLLYSIILQDSDAPAQDFTVDAASGAIALTSTARLEAWGANRTFTMYLEAKELPARGKTHSIKVDVSILPSLSCAQKYVVHVGVERGHRRGKNLKIFTCGRLSLCCFQTSNSSNNPFFSHLVSSDSLTKLLLSLLPTSLAGSLYRFNDCIHQHHRTQPCADWVPQLRNRAH